MLKNAVSHLSLVQAEILIIIIIIIIIICALGSENFED